MINYNYLKKKLNCFFFKFFVFLLLNINLFKANCQEKGGTDHINTFRSSKEVFFNEPSFLITFLSGLTQKASINKETGQYTVKSSPQPFWEAGIDFRGKLNKSLFLIAGLRGIASGRNAVFNAPMSEINPYGYREPYPPLKINEFDFGISIPLLVERKWQTKKYKSTYIQAGLTFRYSLGFDSDDYGNVFTDTNHQEIDVFSMELNSNNHKKLWISYNLGGGYSWILKNYNILKAGVLANISFTKFVNGTYQINIPGKPLTEGTYGVTGSYIGLSVSYGFTGTNKRMTREYEKNNKRF